jgi:hypothetical protein
MTLSIPIRSRLEGNRETVLTRRVTIRWTMKMIHRKRRGKLVRRRRHIGRRRRRDIRRRIRNMRAMISHKYRGSCVAISISKSVEPNEELKVG